MWFILNAGVAIQYLGGLEIRELAILLRVGKKVISIISLKKHHKRNVHDMLFKCRNLVLLMLVQNALPPLLLLLVPYQHKLLRKSGLTALDFTNIYM